jgi:hypothetical protein
VQMGVFDFDVRPALSESDSDSEQREEEEEDESKGGVPRALGPR